MAKSAYVTMTYNNCIYVYTEGGEGGREGRGGRTGEGGEGERGEGYCTSISPDGLTSVGSI